MLKVVAKKSHAVKHDSYLSKRHEIWLWNVTFLKCYFFNLPCMYFTYCSHTSKVICFKFEKFPFERYEIFTVCIFFCLLTLYYLHATYMIKPSWYMHVLLFFIKCQVFLKLNKNTFVTLLNFTQVNKVNDSLSSN